MYRTHNCGELHIKHVNIQVMLCGWIDEIRNFGSIFFIDIRDYFGITQLVVHKNLIKKKLKKEFLIKIYGKVVERYSKNHKLKTGDIEVLINKIEILNKSITTPFIIKNNTDGKEKERMIYRYLDIRRPNIKENLIFRHKIVLEIRNFLSSKNFIEIETPILINNTPEGARSFIVPSRRYKDKFYALPQSPQIFKQLLMIGGIDKYFQIAKCFRDEDPRSDRQIEFTQLDCEMAFVDIKNILNFFEDFIKYLFKINNIQFLKSFPCISYNEAIKKYGTDCPDIRFGMKFFYLKNIINEKNINFLKDKEIIIGIKVKDFFSKKNHNKINLFLEKIKNSNLIWIKHSIDKKFFISKEKHISEKNIHIISNYFNTNPGDFIFISYGEKNIAINLLKKIRSEIIDILSKKNKNIKLFEPIWIINHPLFKWNNKRYKSVHHPFTSPIDEDINLLKTTPENIRSKSYDLVINGVEIASGSIRIYDKKIQKIIFNHLGLSKKEIQSNFGFFIKALKYGAPPHGGIAFGLDRIVNLLKGENDIKNFIAFPKNNFGKDLMTNSPSIIK
ncbi:aspartate--tRNA ligase [Blattabacterium cuenoti]|uniref:aspartate--tRNA ligase n=1 Tax=Blattabacterium cuenoti TaxID=1653831 RepID=UPI00163D2FC9|nr:aspartate--tRNA ligase [Blattabacterium cuenoti]